MRSLSWPSFLYGSTDGIIQTLVIVFAVAVLIQYSSLFEEEYHAKLIHLYVYPWWRIMIIFLVITSALWCPQVGFLVALVVFFYLSDMNTLITPISNL
jgi:hypothetical protein